MQKVLSLLKKHKVTEYEVVIWLTSSLEYRLDDEDENNERFKNLIDELNILSWQVK